MPNRCSTESFGWTNGKIGIPQGFGALFEEENYTLRKPGTAIRE